MTLGGGRWTWAATAAAPRRAMMPQATLVSFSEYTSWPCSMKQCPVQAATRRLTEMAVAGGPETWRDELGEGRGDVG